MSADGNVNEAQIYQIGSIPNSLSTLASAEMFRRLVLTDIVDPNYKFPGINRADHHEILYGTDETIFSGQKWGGMTSDPGIYLQAALEDEIDFDWTWNADWRIFSKLGAGYSSSRHRGEVLTNSYGCLPHVEGGLEFTMAIRTSVPLGIV